jgi:hypothetical protein
MPDRPTSDLKRRGLWSLAILVGIGAVAGIGHDIARRAGAMRPATTTAAAVFSAQPGAHIKLVARVDHSVSLNTYAAQLLESRAEGSYRVTPERLRIALSADTSVVMGSAADLQPGAVVQASGALDGARTLQARQIVILTGYVRIVPD